MARRKLVTVTNSGVIPELRGIGGPILHPQNITIDAIRLMVTHGKKVFEHNPANPSEKIRLTVENVESDNFKKEKPEREVRCLEDSFGFSDNAKVEESYIEDLVNKNEETKLNDESIDESDHTSPITENTTEASEDSVVVLTEETPIQVVIEQPK